MSHPLCLVIWRDACLHRHAASLESDGVFSERACAGWICKDSKALYVYHEALLDDDTVDPQPSVTVIPIGRGARPGWIVSITRLGLGSEVRWDSIPQRRRMKA